MKYSVITTVLMNKSEYKKVLKRKILRSKAYIKKMQKRLKELENNV